MLSVSWLNITAYYSASMETLNVKLLSSPNSASNGSLGTLSLQIFGNMLGHFIIMIIIINIPSLSLRGE